MSERIEDLIETFAFFDDWEDKYRFVIDLGKDLAPMDDAYKIDDNIVRGCQSQVWLHYEPDQSNKLHFQLDSDAFIVKGLISIVLSAVNDKPAKEILAFDFEGTFAQLELLQHLSATRGNGLRAMVERIRLIASRELDQ